MAIKKFKDSEGEWGTRERERGGGARRKGRITVSPLLLSQKMRRLRRRPFGSWRCSGPWSRTTLWSWRKLFAGEGNSTWSLNMLRGSVHQRRHFTLNAQIPTQRRLWKFSPAEPAQLSIKKRITMATYCMNYAVDNGIPHCVAKVSSQVSISWQVFIFMQSYGSGMALTQGSPPPIPQTRTFVLESKSSTLAHTRIFLFFGAEHAGTPRGTSHRRPTW